MNNWRLLLLAVVAVLQPIPSFTERNHIDGHPGCCDHRSNPIITPETRLYGNYRKSNEESRLSIREDVRKEERYGARDDPITRSRERFVVERAESRTTLQPIVKFLDTRFEKDQERYRITVDAREPRHTREDLNRRIQIGQYERDDSESRRIRTARGNSRILRHVAERHQDHLAPQYARNSEDRRISANRESMAVHSRKRDDVTPDVRRDSRINTFHSKTRLQNDNNGDRRTLERNARDVVEKRSRSQGARVNTLMKQNYLRTQVDAQENRRSFRVISELMHQRSDRINSVRRYSVVERMSADRRQESRDNFNRVDISRRETRDQRDDSRRFREDSPVLRDSRINTDAEHRESRETRIPNNVPSERIVRNIVRMDHRREAARGRENARDVRKIDSTVRSERLMRSDERLERRQPLTRSLERNSVLRFSRDSESSEREQNTRDSLSLPENNVRDTRAARHRREVIHVQILDERRQQRDISRFSRDRKISRLLNHMYSAERRQETRRNASFSRLEVNARFEQESLRGVRKNERLDISRPEGDESMLREHNRIETMRRQARELSNSPQSTHRTSNERRTRILARDDTASQRRYFDSRMTSRSETSARLQSTRTLEENREARERDESNAYLSRFSKNTISRESTEDQRREVLKKRNTQTRNEITRNREDVPLGERFEIRRQRDKRLSRDRVFSRRQTRAIHAVPNIERSSRQTISRDDMDIRSERLSRSREDRAINDREFRDRRDFRSSGRSESRRIIEKEIQLNRNRIVMERIDQNSIPANREIRYETKRFTENVLAKDSRRNIDTRFRNLESKVREEVVEKTHESYKAANGQIIFYALQGAYLCGLLMQMLNEKSKMGKSRNFTWWIRSSKNLVKVD